jgi:hypothetical protein
LIEPSSIACDSTEFAELSTQVLRLGKALRFKARGFSMGPMIRDGDSLVIAPVQPSLIKVGDVVLFTRHPGWVVAHRVIRRAFADGAYHFTIQGDRVGSPDGIFHQSHVLGKLTGLERDGEHVDVRDPVWRWLSWMVVLRSRTGLGKLKADRWLRSIAQKSKIFDKYLI